jgi:MYXO-CTERM domain-containing protein
VTFTPTAATAYNANLVIGTSEGTNTSATVALTGTGVIPALTASPTTVSFNEQRVGQTPLATQTFTLRNSGSGTLTVNVPASVSAYTISPNGSRSLRPEDGAQTYTVTFTPTAATAYNANLVIGTSVGTNTSTTVALTGTGVTPTLELVGTTLAFDEQQVGQTTPATRTFTVRNTSSGTLNLNVPASVSRYTISPNGPVSLRSGDGLRTYTVTFNPTASETSNADLDITSDEVGRPTATVRLTGTGVTPTLELVGTALVFGEHRVGAMPRVTRTFTLRNTSTGTLNVNVPASATGYTVSPSGAASLRSGDGPQTYTVTFNPTSPVAYNTSLSITSNDGAMPAATVTLTGAGIRPVLAVPASVEFNQQRVGAVPSETRQVRVTNNGNGPIQITEVAITADRPFTVSSIAPFDLPAQSHHDLTVTFTPTATGPFTAALTLTTNDTEFTSATVALTGTGVRPTLALSSSSLTFNAQRVGTTSAAQELTLRNSGDGMLTVTVPATVSVFSITPNGTFQLGPNVPQVVRVAFNPDAVGDVSASLQLATNQVSQANHFVTFTGTGVRPQLELSPPALSFGAQRAGSFSQPQVVTVRNRGNGPVRVTGVNVTAGTPFMVSSTAPFNLDPDQAHELSVTFSPSAKGPVSASLTLSTDEAISSANPVSLSGTGTTGLDLDPENQLDFGNVPRDTPLVRQVRLINSSSVPVTISSISSLPQVFTVTGIGAGTVVPARSPITFDVTFRPTAQGQVSAALSITSNADNSPHSLTLVGTGTVPVVKLSLADDPAPPIASLPFGGVRVTATKQLVVRLTNVGQAPLIFSGRPTLGTSPSVFAYLGTSTPPTLEPNTSFDFPVSFRPEQAINYSDTLTIPSNVVGGTTALSLSGLGAFPELRLDRTTPIFFGDVRVGSRSNRVPVTINNIGNAEVSLQSLPVEGPYLVEFENATTQLPRPIAARSSFTFYVVFRPSTHADKITGSVSILTDIDNQTAPRVLLEGNGTISEATLAVAEIDFGPQRVRRASGAQPLIITNTGKAELEISQLTFSRNDIFSITSPNPLPTPANPLRIPAGEQQAISMNFTPNTLGTVEGRLFIISNAFVPAPNLTLKGLGVDGQMSLTPSVVRFVEGVQVGGAGSQLSVSLRNSGGSTLTITGVRAPENRAFSVSGLQPGLMLQPGDSWPFTVTFAPTARGYVASSTIIESDAVMNPAFSLALEGTGVAAAVELLPSLVSFGKSNVGVPTTQDISIKNVGEKDLYISNVSFTDFAGDPPGAALEYSVSGTTFPQTVEPGKSILVNLRFNPRVVGMRRARANVFTNAQTQAATAELYGEGTSPSLRLSSPRLDFGNVLVGKPSAPRPLTLTNTGSGPLTLQKLTPGGVDMAAFTITAPTLPLTLQPEASVEVSVSLTPDADRAFSAQLLVESDSSGAPSATVGLSGTGVRQQLQVSPALVDFGQQLLNNRSTSRTVSISNSSDTNITLASLSVEGAESSQFSLVSASLPRVLGPGDRLDVSVFFTPQSENALECQLKVAFNDLPTPFTVTLRGKGIPTVLSIRPNPLEFGAVRAGGPERDLPLTITNLSNEAIVLDAPSITSTGAPFVIRDVVRDRTLAAGTSTIVNVYYRPMTETLSEATMSFGTLSPPQPRSVNVQARGRAVARLLNVDPGDLVDFGRVDVGDPVPTRDIVIVNRSSQDQRVEVKLQSVEGTPFTVDAKALAEPIPAGGSVTVTVGFAPTEAGLVEGVVEVWLEDSIETTVKVSGIGRALMGQGGGCSCGTGGSGGAALMALLALVGMSVRRRRRE